MTNSSVRLLGKSNREKSNSLKIDKTDRHWLRNKQPIHYAPHETDINLDSPFQPLGTFVISLGECILKQFLKKIIVKVDRI